MVLFVNVEESVIGEGGYLENEKGSGVIEFVCIWQEKLRGLMNKYVGYVEFVEVVMIVIR